MIRLFRAIKARIEHFLGKPYPEDQGYPRRPHGAGCVCDECAYECYRAKLREIRRIAGENPYVGELLDEVYRFIQAVEKRNSERRPN